MYACLSALVCQLKEVSIWPIIKEVLPVELLVNNASKQITLSLFKSHFFLCEYNRGDNDMSTFDLLS